LKERMSSWFWTTTEEEYSEEEEEEEYYTDEEGEGADEAHGRSSPDQSPVQSPSKEEEEGEDTDTQQPAGEDPAPESKRKPENSEEEESDDDEELKSGLIPNAVSRSRTDSYVSTLDDEEVPEAVSEEEAVADKEEAEEEEQEEEATSTAEKHSLMILAAEHDRVDILQAILSDTSERETLLREGIPLHIAASYGSVNAVNCLMRMGADPSIRPNAEALQSEHVEINMKRFDGRTAWELVFEETEDSSTFGSWRRSGSSIDIPPSKKEGIRHAFTAEALRCIGADEVQRLQQLVDSGMPSMLELGGKTLYDWAIEMQAFKCEELLRPDEAARHANGTTNSSSEEPTTTSSSVLDRPGDGESLSHLANRLDELENLSRALSVSLDALAEEASVCNGLLLMGGGATALASHVRSLRATKERKMEELTRLEEAWENSEDELAYWVREGGPEAEKLAAQIMFTAPQQRQGEQEDEEAEQRQLKAQIAASEIKVRKLRASIVDISEACTRDLKEVTSRGLTGGVKMVRGLRDEIRDIEFALGETKSAEAACRAKISLIQSKIKSGDVTPVNENGHSKAAPSESHAEARADTDTPEHAEARADTDTPESGIEDSERIAKGESTAIALRHDGRGFFPVSLWEILMRIIGMSHESSTRGSIRRPVMVV
jgi:hypothetical protein